MRIAVIGSGIAGLGQSFAFRRQQVGVRAEAGAVADGFRFTWLAEAANLADQARSRFKRLSNKFGLIQATAPLLRAQIALGQAGAAQRSSGVGGAAPLNVQAPGGLPSPVPSMRSPLGAAVSGGANPLGAYGDMGQGTGPVVQGASAERPALGTNQFQRFVQNATGRDLPLHGYNLFNGQKYSALANLPVPAGYVLGPGDDIDLKLWGSVDMALRLTVDRNGQIMIPKIGPVTVAGTSRARSRPSGGLAAAKGSPPGGCQSASRTRRCAVRVRPGEASFAEFDLPRMSVSHPQHQLDRQGLADAARLADEAGMADLVLIGNGEQVGLVVQLGIGALILLAPTFERLAELLGGMLGALLAGNLAEAA